MTLSLGSVHNNPEVSPNSGVDLVPLSLTRNTLTSIRAVSPAATSATRPLGFTPDNPQTTIDEVRVWSFARTAAEIESTMLILLSGADPGLVHYWPMDEGSGQQTSDMVGGNHIRLGVSPDPDDQDPMWTETEWFPPLPVDPVTWGAVKAGFR